MELQLTTPTWWLSKRALLTWWFIAGAALQLGLGLPPVQRTQEARVLETAREMPGSGWRGWMVPQCDGQVRVRKPPLTYWMAAIAYKIGGVSEGVGRVPTALLGWLTLATTFFCGQWLFGRRAGFFAAGCLLCSYLFFRFTRLAETDAPAMLFVTLATYAFWRGVEAPREGEAATEPGSRADEHPGSADFGELPSGLSLRVEDSQTRTSPSQYASPHSAMLWYHLAAAATALAIMSKGPPGIYPPLFFVLIVAMRRRWDALRRFIVSGAPITLILLAAPWFVYVFHAVGIEQWKRESDELLGGEDHSGHFYQYFVELFKATAPWCLLMPGALIAGVQHRRDPRISGLLVWLLVLFVPLCLLANKQFHYLLPLMPPMMILIGWWLDLVLRPSSTGMKSRPVPLLDITFLLTALGIVAVPLAAHLMLKNVRPLDWSLAGAIAAALLLVGWAHARRGRTTALLVYLVAVLAVMVPAISLLAPRYDGEDSRQIARQIGAHFGRGPYCFYGLNLSLQLCFNWKIQIPQEQTAADLEGLAATEPDVVVIAQTKPAHAPPELPSGFKQQWRLPLRHQTMVFYRRGATLGNAASLQN